MTIPDLDARLAAAQEAWQGAAAVTGGMYDPPPDDEYQGLIHKFEFFDSNAGALLKIWCQVQNHPMYSGRLAGELYNLEDPNRLPYLKGVMATLGVDVENTPITELVPGSPTLNALLDTPVLFRVRRSEKTDSEGKPYVNVFINARLGDPVRQDGSTDSFRTGSGGFTPRSDVPDPGGFDPVQQQMSGGGTVPADDIPF